MEAVDTVIFKEPVDEEDVDFVMVDDVSIDASKGAQTVIKAIKRRTKKMSNKKKVTGKTGHPGKKKLHSHSL